MPQLPSPFYSVNPTWAASFGFTQWMPERGRPSPSTAFESGFQHHMGHRRCALRKSIQYRNIRPEFVPEPMTVMGDIGAFGWPGGS